MIPMSTNIPVGVFNPLHYGPLPLWQDLLSRQPTLARYGLAMLVLMLPTLLALGLDERLIREVPVWIKPLKFMASTALFAFTTAWFMPLVPAAIRQSRSTKWMVWTLISTSAFEVAYISFQAGMGSGSHYNIADSFHAVMYGLMAMAAVLLTATQAWLGWQIFRATRSSTPSVFVLSVIAGLSLTFVLSVISGFALGGKQPPAGEGWAFLGWHMQGGDGRPAHFLAVHAQQLIPLMGYLAHQRLKRRGLWAVAAGILAYLCLWLFLLGRGLVVF